MPGLERGRKIPQTGVHFLGLLKIGVSIWNHFLNDGCFDEKLHTSFEHLSCLPGLWRTSYESGHPKCVLPCFSSLGSVSRIGSATRCDERINPVCADTAEQCGDVDVKRP